MYIPKRYGESRRDGCPFCGKQATTANSESVPVCISHKKSALGDMKCVCGNYLDLRKGRFGVFFTCISCGAISLPKALEANAVKDVSVKSETKKEDWKKSHKKNEKGEIQIRSDDPDFF
ncbi:hypothetical protein HYY72_00685 [Candidatus Woesearchaeota archaeon]|nr:hypothetical protein [Candidatus Woesearchaeota archaeon]